MAAAATDTLGFYVYGITLGDVACPAETVDVGRLRAVVRREPLARYDTKAVEAAVKEPGWLETQLRTHESVLASVHEAGPVAPFRFGTIFKTEAELREALARAQAGLGARLEELRGTSEWGVKPWIDDEVLRRWFEENDCQARRERAEITAATEPGRRYLLERRLARRVAAEAAELALDRVHDAHAVLAAEAREASMERPSGFDEQGARRPLVRASYLLSADRLASFEAALSAMQKRDSPLGIEYVVSGPWPPYSFVDPHFE